METKEKGRKTGQSRRPVGSGTAGSARRPSGAVATKQRTAKTPVRRPQPRPAPDVVYTQPGPFNRDRFFLQLLTVIAVVLALVFGMSIFFKVDESKILVSGTQKYTAHDVLQASGIQDGENLLTLREAEISGRIISELPYVKQVRIGIKLPDAVNIEIVESDVVYSVEAGDGSWWLIRSDGKIVEKTNAADAAQYTTVVGVKLAEPAVGEQAVAVEPTPDTTDAEGQTVPTTVLGSEQLETAVSIFKFLESNGIIGDAASVDVTNMGSIQLWYGDRYQVILGDTTQMSYKISTMKSAIDEMKEYASGVLDVSFTIMEDQVIYTPFS